MNIFKIVSFICFTIIVLSASGCAMDGTAGSAARTCKFVIGEASAIYCDSFYNSLLLNVKEYNMQNGGIYFNSLGYQIDSDQGQGIFLAYLAKHPEDKGLPVFQVYLNAMSNFFKPDNS